MTFRSLTKVLLTLSAVAVVASLVLFFYPGPKYSIEFTGGTLMQIQAAGKTRADVLSAAESYEKTSGKDLGNVAVTGVKAGDEEAFLLRMAEMTNDEHQAMLTDFGKTLGTVKELQYTTIGPSLSASLKVKSFQAIALASAAIIFYLALAFRKLPRRLKPWKFGVLAVVAFIHDIVITTGLFIVLGWFTSFEFDTLFVTALLTILAYSGNDTIVIFDRIRANLGENRNDDLAQVIQNALRQCFMRTVGTSVAILIMLTSIFIMGAESIRWFILALMFGLFIGAYSSYFVAAPLLLYWKDKQR